MFLYSSAVFAALAASGFRSVFAQSSSSLNISSECASALTKLEISSDAQCLDISGVIGLFSTNGSVLSVTNKWLSTLCNQTACTNSSLAAVVTALTEGCSTELSELSAPSNLTTYVQGNYRILRDIGCLRNNSEGGFCSTDRIEESQNKSGTNYTTTNAFAFLPELFTSGLAVLLPPQTACDNCSKATLNLILSEAPWNISNTENTTISDTCGSSFLDGQKPTDISEISPSSNTSNTSTSPTTASPVSSTTHQNGAYRSVTLWDGLTSLTVLGVFLTALL